MTPWQTLVLLALALLITLAVVGIILGLAAIRRRRAARRG